MFDPSHSLDEQPPPPGDETETIKLQPPKEIIENDNREKNQGQEELKDFPENGSKGLDVDSKRSDHHHHHKKSRGKNYDTSSEDKKSRDKKKRKKSKEHEKKKSKKDRKVRDTNKKSSNKVEPNEQTPESVVPLDITVKEDDSSFINKTNPDVGAKAQDETSSLDDRLGKSNDTDRASKVGGDQMNRSDSILDINPNIDLEMDEYAAPEVSKWERDEYKSAASFDNSEVDLGNGDAKKSSEEKVTTEILKRAENAIFARAISAIRPMEVKKSKSGPEHDASGGRKESPIASLTSKKSESSLELKAFQVTVPANESGFRSVEIKTPENKRESSRQKKSPPMRTSIKNRLGIKVVEKKERSSTPPRSPRKRLQSDLKVVRQSTREENRGYRSQAEKIPQASRERHPSSENRRNTSKPLSSCIRVSNEASGSSRGNRSRYSDKRRSPSPEDRKVKRFRSSRSHSSSRHNARRNDRRSPVEKKTIKSKEPARNDDMSPKAVDPLPSESEKSKARKESRKDVEASSGKKKRDSSSSSSASSSVSSAGSQKQSKRHGKHKVKKKSRSLSAEDSSAKRKKSKKKSKKKKKSSRK